MISRTRTAAALVQLSLCLAACSSDDRALVSRNSAAWSATVSPAGGISTGVLSERVQAFVDVMPDEGTCVSVKCYRLPTDAEQLTMTRAVRTILSLVQGGAFDVNLQLNTSATYTIDEPMGKTFTGPTLSDSTLAPINLRARQYYEPSMNRVLIVLEPIKRSASEIGDNGTAWGMYVFNTRPRSQSIVENPHPIFDLNSHLASVQAFSEGDELALFIAGAHRLSAGKVSSSKYGAADVAHMVDPATGKLDATKTTLRSIFQVAHEAALEFYRDWDGAIVQLHGYGHDAHTTKFPWSGNPPSQCCNVVVSAGPTKLPATGDTRLAADVRTALAETTLPPSGSVPYWPAAPGSTDLEAGDNAQGAACERRGVPFVHVEPDGETISSSGGPAGLRARYATTVIDAVNQYFERLRVVFLPIASLTGSKFSRTVVFGFDRNGYPGDEHMLAWGKSRMSFAGYHLANTRINSLVGASERWSDGVGALSRRAKLRRMGWGLLPLYYGRKSGAAVTVGGKPNPLHIASGDGTADARDALARATVDGFPGSTRIYLDVEDSGFIDVVGSFTDLRGYIAEWFSVFNSTTENPLRYPAGVYCSPLDVGGIQKIAKTSGIDDIGVWVHRIDCAPTTEQFPSSDFPGCRIPTTTLDRKRYEPAFSGTPSADVWQYAQSPRYYEKEPGKECGSGEREVIDANLRSWCDLAPNCPYAVSNKCNIGFGGGYTTNAATCGEGSGEEGGNNYDCVPAFAGDFKKFTTFVDLNSLGIGRRPVVFVPIPNPRRFPNNLEVKSAGVGLEQLDLTVEEQELRALLAHPIMSSKAAQNMADRVGVSPGTLNRWRAFVGRSWLEGFRLRLNLKATATVDL